MRNKTFFIIMTSLFSFIFGCSAQSDKYRSVTVDEFEKTISDTSVVRLDVRTAEEYAEGHIEKALNIDVKGSDFTAKAKEMLPRDKTIAVYCRSGRRSKMAAELLSDAGYKIVELDSGWLGWSSAGKQSVK